MLAARKKKFQSARRMSRSSDSAPELFMVPDNRVSPSVEDPAANEKAHAKEKASSCDEASVVFALI